MIIWILFFLFLAGTGHLFVKTTVPVVVNKTLRHRVQKIVLRKRRRLHLSRRKLNVGFQYSHLTLICAVWWATF